MESNLSFENALDVLVSAELTNQKALLESASNLVCRNKGRLNKTGAYNEIYVQCQFNKIYSNLLAGTKSYRKWNLTMQTMHNPPNEDLNSGDSRNSAQIRHLKLLCTYNDD